MINSISSMAPLASMEDISLAGTPRPTPRPSPRTRSRWSHRSSLGIILDEEEEDKSDKELDEDQTAIYCDTDSDQTAIDNDTDPLLSTNTDLPIHTSDQTPTAVALRSNGPGYSYSCNSSSPHKLPGCDTKYPLSPLPPPAPPAPHNTNTKPVAQMQFLTPRRNFRKRSELYPVYEYFEIGEAERPAAHDSFNLVFFNFVFQGFTTTLPFSLITVSKKFHQGVFNSCHDSFPDCQDDFSWLKSLPNFLLVSLTLHLISALPSSLFPVRWFSMRVSISIAALVISVLMLVLSFLTNLSLYLIFPCMVLHSIFSGLYITTICGMVARLPTRHTAAVFLGMSMSGAVASLLEFVDILLNLSTRIVIIYYLIIILAAYLIAFDLHFALPLSTYYQNHQTTKQPAVLPVQYRQYTLYTLLYISTCITSAVCPMVLKGIAPLSSIFISKEQSFTILVCYLNYYLSTCLGILAYTFSYLPCSWIPIVLTILRLVLIPILLFSNYLPDTRELVVVVNWDWTAALTVTIFAMLGGFVHMQLVVSTLRYFIVVR